ncbi:MAG TPA: hypothetical protein VIY47_10470 [Ignavibacteriaceae bacterium]
MSFSPMTMMENLLAHYYHNMTKIIGIDLDEVLAETLDKILEDNNYILAGKEVSREDILDYYIFNNKHLNISLDE